MSYSKRGNAVFLKCDFATCHTAKSLTLLDQETSLDGYRRLWTQASHWRTSGTNHYCPAHA
jgi:hypothetical protein